MNISETVRDSIALLQRITDRKSPMGNRMVTWPKTSRAPERSSHDPNTLKAQSISGKQLEMRQYRRLS